ncbi:MAG: hypothetical protein ACO1O6_06165 [Bacteroidota bacterium]
MKTLFLKRQFWAFFLPLLIIGFCVSLAGSELFSSEKQIFSQAITCDLLLTSPILYFLLIRKTSIPRMTVVPVFIAGLWIASAILPEEQRGIADLLKLWFLPLLEIALLVLVIFKVRKAVRSYKLQKASADFCTALKTSCAGVLPSKAAAILASEIALFYYAFFSWKSHKPSGIAFSYHRKTPLVALFVMLLIAIPVETYVVHILVARVSEFGAWILSVLSLYSIVLVLGLLKSILRRPIVIRDDCLVLRCGILAEAELSREEILSVEPIDVSFGPGPGNRSMPFLGEMMSPNFVLCLKEEKTLQGLYGTGKKFRKLAFYVDEKSDFQEQIRSFLGKGLQSASD